MIQERLGTRRNRNTLIIMNLHTNYHKLQLFKVQVTCVTHVTITRDAGSSESPCIQRKSKHRSIHFLPPSVCRDSSVGIRTRYGLNGPGIEFWWRRDFPYMSRPALGPTQPPIQWVPGFFPGGNRPGSDVDHPPHLAPRLKKEYGYTSTPPLVLRGLL
jgi:hypothetical protein